MGKDTQPQKTHSGGGLTKKLQREFSSGGVVFKGDKWLVAASMPSKLFPNIVWRLPKGWLDDSAPGVPGPMGSGQVRATEDILQKTAIREVGEETGVEAKIIKKIGTQRFFYTHPVRGRILKFVTSYLMEWVRDLPQGFDGETSEIRWLPYDEAYKLLSIPREKEVLKMAYELRASLAQRTE